MAMSGRMTHRLLFGFPVHGLVLNQPVVTYGALQVKGKCNAISIDKCQKTGVVFEDVIAVCELVNCTSVQVCGTFEPGDVIAGRCYVQIVHVYQCCGVQLGPNHHSLLAAAD